MNLCVKRGEIDDDDGTGRCASAAVDLTYQAIDVDNMLQEAELIQDSRQGRETQYN